MNVLIVFGSTEGQTRKICEFLQDEARKVGHSVTVGDSTMDSPRPYDYDAVIIGTSVHAGEYQDSVKRYIRTYHQALNKRPSVFMSVSLTAASDEPESWEELKQITSQFLTATGWKPTMTEQVAGALRYTEYNFFKKFIMRMIAKKHAQPTDTSKDYEYTDWEQVKHVLKNLENEAANEKAKLNLNP